MHWDITGAALVVHSESGLVMVREEAENLNIGKKKGMISFPAGHVRLSSGETPRMAALREFQEETGLKAKIRFPIGLFSLRQTGINVRIFVFCGELLVPESSKNKAIFVPTEHFVDIPTESIRPPCHEVFQVYRALSLTTMSDKDLWDFVLDGVPTEERDLLL